MINSDQATIQYRLNIPHALYSISPALAALHTSRAIALHPEVLAVLRPTHCPKCGTYRFSGDHSPYPVSPSARKKRLHAISPHTKSFRRRCHMCGFLIDAFDNSSAQLPGDTSRTTNVSIIPRTEQSGQEQPRSTLAPETIQMPECPPPKSRELHKASHTKTTTLKDMLSRDRRREDVTTSNKKQKESHGGLAAFLKEL